MSNSQYKMKYIQKMFKSRKNNKQNVINKRNKRNKQYVNIFWKNLL